MKNSAYYLVAYAMLVLGVIGIIVPILPGIPFLIVAGLMLTVNTPGLRRKILSHDRVAPMRARFDRRGPDGLNVVDRVKLKSLMFLEAVLPKK